MINVLFVCLGNICRSPTAEGVFKEKVDDAGLTDQINTDSAGTGVWHIGKLPDARAIQVALKRGYDLSDLRARQINQMDFEKFDYILAMDSSNLSDIYGLCPQPYRSKLQLFLNHAPAGNSKDLQDPYFDGSTGFDAVLSLIEQASDGLLTHIIKKHP